MSQHLVFLLLGLGSGAVFAALALGLVLSYRSSGVVNFATGATALFGAYAYSSLRQGEVLVLVPPLPATVDIGGDPGMIPSILLAVLQTALLGAFLYAVVFRSLRTAPPVAKAVASLGVMVTLQALFAVRLGTTPVKVGAIFPRGTFTIGGARVPTDRLWFAGVIILVGVLLAIVLRRTRFGTATRAAAESEKGAIVTGINPQRIALLNWALSAAVAGLGGILISPIVPLAPNAYTLLIVPALAAALIANFRALAVATVAALAIGMVQSELTYLQSIYSWMPQNGVADVVPLIIILGYLLLKGQPLPDRGAIILKSLGRAPRPRHPVKVAIVASAIGLVALVSTSGSYRAGIITSMILAIVALSLVVVTGFAGQVSFAQLALAGVGAFLLSRLTHNMGVPFPIAPLLAATGAAIVGMIVGLPALRIRGLPVAVVTLCLAVALEALWFRNPQFTDGFGGARVESPSLFGLDLGVGGGGEYPRIAFGVLCLVVLVAVALTVAKLRRTELGAAMLAIRANERAAAATGINVARTKIVAFAIAAFIAGLGGSLLAYQQTLASPDMYSAFAGFGFFASAYVAGITSVSGGLLAGIIAAGGITYLLLNDLFATFGEWYDVLIGAILVISVIRNPEGIATIVHHIAAFFERRFRKPVPAIGPAPATTGEPSGGDLAVAARQSPVAGPPVLTLSHLTVRYGGVVAVDDVSFVVKRNTIVGLIGPNGAGKTTVIDALSGFNKPGGSVELDGHDLMGVKPHERIRLGLGRTFQSLELWEDLTVLENVKVSAAAGRSAEHPATPDSLSSVDDVISLLGLDEVTDRAVKELSQGQRQLVSIARALTARPEVLLLDEPAGGLDSSESLWLGERLCDIRDAGVTILLVDHDMGLVLKVCDDVQVMDLGRLIASGPPDEIRNDRQVREAYLGTSDEATIS